MDLKEIDLKKLIPQFMRKDDFFSAFADAMSDMFQVEIEKVELISRVGKEENLSEEMLDEIAWENNLFWYFKDEPIEVKRKNIKNYRKVLNSLGTPAALYSILTDIYSNADLQDSFNYPDDYEVHEFGVLVKKLESFSEENKNRLIKRINDVKRASQKLKEIFFYDSSLVKYYIGMGQAEIIEEYTKTIAWPNATMYIIRADIDYGLYLFMNISDCSAVVAE